MQTYPATPTPASYTDGHIYFVSFDQYQNLLESKIVNKEKQDYIEITYSNIKTSEKETLEAFYQARCGTWESFYITDWVTNTIYKARFADELKFSLVSYDRWNSSTIRINYIIPKTLYSAYIYAAGQITRTIRQYNLNDLVYTEVESPNYGSTIRATCISGDYIYAVGQATRTIRQYNLSDLTATGLESAGYGADIYAICSDGTYLYIGGAIGTGEVQKYRISDMQLMATSSSIGATIHSLAYDNGSVYVGTYGKYKIYRLDADDLSAVDDRAYNGYCYNIIIDDGYMYNNGTRYVDKVSTTDWATATATRFDFGSGLTLHGLATDTDYVYSSVNTGGSTYIYKLQKSDMTQVKAGTTIMGTYAHSIAEYGQYIYAPYTPGNTGVGADTCIAKLAKANLNIVKTYSKPAYGGPIYSILTGR